MKPIICLRKLAALGLVAALCLEAPGLQAYAAMGEISNPSGEPLLMKVDAPLGSPISMGEGSDHLNEPSLQMPGIPLSSADQLKEINQEIPTLIQPQTVGIKKENLAEKKLVTPPTSETQMPANQKISKTPSSFSIRKLATILKNTFSFSSINKDAGIEANPSQKTLSRFFDGSLSAQMSSKNVNRDISRLSPNSSLKRFNASGNSKIPPSSQNDFPNVPPGPWGSSSPRVGLSYTGMKYLAMRTFSAFFDQVNRYKPWYALPRTIAAFNLAAIEMRMRLINIFNTDAYASRTPLIGQATSDQIRAQNPAGLGHDTAAPQMGAANARFNRASKPELHGGTVPSTIADTLVRASNELEKREHFIPARILNVHAAAWIQFMVHDWMNHVRAPIADNPHKIALPAGHPLNEKEMTLDRTAANGSRPENDPGAPTYQNTETHWWDLSMIYGSSPEILKGLRSFEGGKMIIGDDGRLPADPMKEGVDKTGFNSNYWTGLSILHTLFVKEHNSIAEALAAEHPQWTDQQLFEKARLINVALAAKIHTVEWTRALLPNSTMQVSMWADWYGVIGKKTKLWLMTHIYPRYPRLAKWLTVLRESEYLSGVPGTRYDHFTGPYAMPEEFVEVYRLHPLLPDQYVVRSAESGRVLGELDLTALQGKHTRDITGQYKWSDLISSFGSESAGALVLNNFPETLRNIVDMEGRKLDMSVVDMFRLRERAPELTFNEFRRRIGMRPAKDFLDLTGGDQILAERISRVYNGEIEKVDLQIGLRAVPKPKGFAISDEAFRIFILMAPRRLKSDRFLSELYGPNFYTPLGFDWVEHNNMRTLVLRHYPELRSTLEGLDNFFAPWPAAGYLPRKLYSVANNASWEMIKKGFLSVIAGGVVVFGATLMGAASPLMFAAAVAPFIGMISAALMRMSALGETEHVVKYSDTDISQSLYGPIFHAENVGRRAALIAKLSALFSVATSGALAYHALAFSHPALALTGAALMAYLGLSSARSSKRFANTLNLTRIGVYSQLKNAELAKEEAMPGATALERHGRFFSDGAEIATFKTSYHQLRKTGLPMITSLMTALLAQLTFGRKSQKAMTPEQRARLSPGFFNIYVPGLINAQSSGNSRIWAHADLPNDVKHGDVDNSEIDRLFRQFAVGRDYLTAYDLKRMSQANLDRDSSPALKRLIGNLASRRSFAQLLEIGADRVVWEDDQYGKLVPALSRKRVENLFQGSALYDIAREHTAAKQTP